MNSTEAGLRFPPEAARRLSPRDRERNFLLLMVVLIWAAIIGGFAPEIVHHVRSTSVVPFPPIVYFHAVAFGGWLAFFTSQVLLIRAHQTRLHASLGLIGAVLAGSMIVLGPWAAFVTDRIHLGTPQSDPAFLSTQLIDIAEFGGLVIAGLMLNAKSPAHRRLMLLATLSIVDAGFGRIMGTTLEDRFSVRAWTFFSDSYLGGDLLVLLVGVHDWVTRRRLHPAYVAGCIWILGGQALATWLYLSASWKPVALALIRR